MIYTSIHPDGAYAKDQWTRERANDWHKSQPWLIGANFIPSTAMNQLECWQADTFDIDSIERELGFAQKIGMNIMRVFLHHLLWDHDSQGLIERIQTYLTIADRHNIKTMFVLFDDCWNPEATAGKQPEVKPGVHNSGWLQCPGKLIHGDPAKWGILESYTKGIISAFRTDERILLWDVYNEPGNSAYGRSSLPLLEKVMQWSRAAMPEQPISVGLWHDDVVMNDFFLYHSDVITFHSYNDQAIFHKEIETLLSYGRPIICTEYMARKSNSLFTTHLPMLKEKNVGAINWGLVSGKTNTIYPYLSTGGTSEPDLWFHDIFRKDGTAFDPKEAQLIRRLAG